KLCEAIGRGDLIEDARFGSSVQRYANRTELTAEIESVLATKPREHWISVIGNANVPVAPVNHVDEMMAHPQARAVQIIDRLPGSEAEENAFEAVRLPVRFDGERATYREAGPPLGEHTADILGPYL
ncbi:MAG: CoA transferase, partial [Chromatiales bacterium]|nr:CoA transferase [Chromatiales bacterium]